jgi:hypothetical protein
MFGSSIRSKAQANAGAFLDAPGTDDRAHFWRFPHLDRFVKGEEKVTFSREHSYAGRNKRKEQSFSELPHCRAEFPNLGLPPWLNSIEMRVFVYNITRYH